MSLKCDVNRSSIGGRTVGGSVYEEGVCCTVRIDTTAMRIESKPTRMTSSGSSMMPHTSYGTIYVLGELLSLKGAEDGI
jgi:hypothetical protein